MQEIVVAFSTQRINNCANPNCSLNETTLEKGQRCFFVLLGEAIQPQDDERKGIKNNLEDHERIIYLELVRLICWLLGGTELKNSRSLILVQNIIFVTYSQLYDVLFT